MYIRTEKKIPTKKMDKISDLIKFKFKTFYSLTKFSIRNSQDI